MLLPWIWFATRPGSSVREKLALLERMGSPEAIYDCTAFPDFPGREAWLDKDLSRAEQILEQCAGKKIHILTWQDRKYPEPLRSIGDPPLLLYYKGKLPDFSGTALIGVVGTRKATGYGLQMARQLGYQLTRCGGLVVTGMAAGIDAMAAEGGCLAGGPVVGVLGCGADRVYPRENRELYERVLEQKGCLLSEYPPGTPPNAWQFPHRNRIISGLSCGVVVVEAPEKSGALITARRALEQGRDVFAVPGNLGVAGCAGSNSLLREGAILITGGWDVLSEYTGRFPDRLHPDPALLPVSMLPETEKKRETTRNIPEKTFSDLEVSNKKSVDKREVTPYSGVDTATLSEDERAVFLQLTHQARLMDDVIAGAGIPAGKALAALTMLQIKGFAQALPGRFVALQERKT